MTNLRKFLCKTGIEEGQIGKCKGGRELGGEDTWQG